jgi:hypothetical protein
MMNIIGPTYYVRHPDDSYSAADPQPRKYVTWNQIETAPRDGRRLLMTDGERIEICHPKRFPRPLDQMATPEDAAASKPGDKWEYFRDEDNAPGRSWSMIPTHWMELPPLLPT